MTCKVIKTDKAPGAIGPYSQAIFTPPLLFVSGQLGMKPGTGELVSEALAEQARQALDNLCNIVKAAGGAVSNIVSVDVFITDIQKFVEFNNVYQEFFQNTSLQGQLWR